MKDILFYVICICWGNTIGMMLANYGLHNFNTILAIIGCVSWIIYTCPLIKKGDK